MIYRLVLLTHCNMHVLSTLLYLIQALKHFLRCPENEEGAAIDMAIEVVGRSNDNQLHQQLIEYLMGDTDNMPKVS